MPNNARCSTSLPRVCRGARVTEAFSGTQENPETAQKHAQDGLQSSKGTSLPRVCPGAAAHGASLGAPEGPGRQRKRPNRACCSTSLPRVSRGAGVSGASPGTRENPETA